MRATNFFGEVAQASSAPREPIEWSSVLGHISNSDVYVLTHFGAVAIFAVGIITAGIMIYSLFEMDD